MDARTRRIVATAVAIIATGGAVSHVVAQPAAPTTQPASVAAPQPGSFPYTGYITGTNVYIRSGPDQNYYPVTKLNTGDPVTVHAQQFGWLAIDPPTGTFSLVDKAYVYKLDDSRDTGSINADAVWVRAGSLLSEHRYAKLVQLNKNDRVHILGLTDDGQFYKIAPPPGARLWVSSAFVKSGQAPGAAGAPAAGTVQRSPAPVDRERLDRVRVRKHGTPTRGPTTQPASPMGTYADEIASIETAIAAEAKKARSAQDYTSMIDRLRPIAAQEDEPVAKLYAERRMEQLQAKMDLARLFQDVSSLSDEAREEHQIALLARRSIQPPPERTIDGRVEARGELRPSEVFRPESKAFPKRYRLVDPETSRTVAYVERPEGSNLNLTQYLGKFVLVKARTRKLTAGTIQPISVLVADEIRVVPPKRFSAEMIEMPLLEPESPAPSAAPTTQPAAPRANQPVEP
jgi:hypothetical protein